MQRVELIRRVELGALVAAVALAMAPVRAVAQTGEVGGVVRDASGAPVPGVVVSVESAGVEIARVTTGQDGRFLAPGLDPSAVIVLVIARADRFADAVAEVRIPEGNVRLVLHPAPIVAAITVTARAEAAGFDTPVSASVVMSSDLALTAAGAIDDKLLQTPGFSLFRRQSSRVANPTAQGVTLRGVSGSGASRTKVLADGMPLNDPFGNWVYWNRIPEVAIDRIEVLRGASGDLFGEASMGGVIRILTFDPDQPMLRASFEGGSRNTTDGSAFAGGRTGPWSYQASGEFHHTDGYVIVADDERGAADVEAFANHGTGFAGLGYAGSRIQARLRAGLYDEDRGNGTPVQVNNTKWQRLGGELGGTTAAGSWTATLAGGTQEFYQTFSAVISNRNDERLVRAQLTTTDFFAASGQFLHALGSHVLLVGGEGSWTDGVLDNTGFSFGTGLPTGTDQLGGTEHDASVFGQVRLNVGDRLTGQLGARGEFWSADPLLATDPAHSANFFSPRGTVAYQMSASVQVQASAYRSYRAPTLNELYRGFQVGSIVTLANATLEPERLTGLEGGMVLTRGMASARVTAFYNHLDDAIANVTLDPGDPNLRQRRNAGRIRAAGIEIEADLHPHPTLSLRATTVFTRATFRGSGQLAELEGNAVPQVPRWQVGGSVTYSDPAYLTASMQVRGTGAQFDDDLNAFTLDAYGVVDLLVSRSVARGVNVFAAIENLFDQEYDVRFNPRSIGWPRTMRIGARVTLP